VVTVTGAAAQDSVASSVAAVLDKYFSAINSHQYHAYKGLLALQLQQGLTRASFNSGYQGTIDSAIRLINISSAADGDTQAVLKFTSHQAPNAANNQESCTKWHISLFLVQGVAEGISSTRHHRVITRRLRRARSAVTHARSVVTAARTATGQLCGAASEHAWFIRRSSGGTMETLALVA
jgi:hypothetical protein